MKSIVIILLLSFSAIAQSVSSDPSIDEILTKARLRATEYSTRFENLSATEKKTQIVFDSKGHKKDRREIKSFFFVYEHPTDGSHNEFRHVIEVDGKNKSRTESELAHIFDELKESHNDSSIVDRLKMEAWRYDIGVHQWGITTAPFYPFMVPETDVFQYELEGSEMLSGRDTWKIPFRQLKESDGIVAWVSVEKLNEMKSKHIKAIHFNSKISPELLPANPRIKGTLWIDKETGAVFKSEYTVEYNPPSFNRPATAMRSEIEFQTSKFQIFVPKTIRFWVNEIKGKENPIIRQIADTTYEYLDFSEFRIDVNQ